MTEMLLQKFLRETTTPHPLDYLKDEMGITAKRHGLYPNLVLFKYNQISSDFNDPMVRECRGVILDEDDGWLCVSRGFDKFGNFGEGYCPTIDWSTARVQEKLDGSLCVLYHYREEWHVATSGTPDASGDVNGGGITFKDYFWRTWSGRELPEWSGIGDVFIFELTGPLNRVVVPHQEARLTLLAVRNVTTGREFDRAGVMDFAQMLGVPAVMEYPLQSFEDMRATFFTIPGLHNEGYVVVDDSFGRVKVKHPGYVALHHAKGGMGPKAFLEIARGNEVDEVSLVFPDFANSIKKARFEIDWFANKIQTAYARILDLKPESQKEFAQQAVLSPYAPALFAIRNGKAPSAEGWVKNLSIDKLMEYLPPGEWM